MAKKGKEGKGKEKGTEGGEERKRTGDGEEEKRGDRCRRGTWSRK